MNSFQTALAASMKQGTYFERLLTRFSVPEELFGPLSMKSLENDIYERQTAGYLPEASVAFVDEIFKANSAILNSLLTILNERLFDNGAERYPVPLICMVGASNELPESEELDALYDRFLIRREVAPVSAESLRELLDFARTMGSVDYNDESEDPSTGFALDLDELRGLRLKALQAVTLPEHIVDLLIDLRDYLQQKCEPPVYVSDRRMVKVVSLLRIAAYTSGRTTVSEIDCLLLQHTLWQRPEQAEIIREWVLHRMAQDKDATQIQYLFTGLFQRTCHANASPELKPTLLNEVRSLRQVVMQQLRDVETNPMTTGKLFASRKEIGQGEDSHASLWLSEEDCVRAKQSLVPLLKKSQTALEAQLEELLMLEVALEKDTPTFVLAEIWPEKWSDLIRSYPL
eukprot:gene6501-7794_t